MLAGGGLGAVALAAAAALLSRQARVRARLADAVERGALPAAAGSCRRRAARVRSASTAGRRGAAARRRGSRARAATARRTCAAPSCSASRAATRRSARLQAGDVLIVADEELAGARRGGRRAGRRGDRRRHDAAGVGAPCRRRWCCRSPTSPRRKARSPTCAAACSGSCRPRRRRASRGRATSSLGDLLAAMGEGSGYFTAGRRLRALAAARPAFAGLSYDALGTARRRRCTAARRGSAAHERDRSRHCLQAGVSTSAVRAAADRRVPHRHAAEDDRSSSRSTWSASRC